MAPPEVSRDAELLYDYHQLHMTLHRKVDAVFCLCSLDTRVAERAAALFLDGYGDYLIFSGGSGKLTEGRFSKPEAEVFADIALQMGVPRARIIVEPLSTNTGENVRFAYTLLQKKGLLLRSFILVQKPYMERRTFATFKRQWPDESTDISVTSPQLSWKDYPNEENPQDLVINIAVGDLIRIRDYPAKGFQIPQDIPDGVWQAAQRLVRAGYDSHLP
ncbi:Uu.00g056500.m01.CDS01 [Anthostomella pinea]|uniref:Uu.00g056500.m01.CDS01 n=1 Tax=Anthostomella pinea TaxID=933095 RepID=A0AAI8VRI5_9PEZI|nr:Uu.00g056500.m01.CDS01 [Anthostomella pinea]